MKLLKKLLLIGLFSFIFCINASALTNSNNVVLPTFTEDADYHYAITRGTSGWVFYTYCENSDSYLTVYNKNDDNVGKPYYTNIAYCVSSLNGSVSNVKNYRLDINNNAVYLSDSLVFSNDIIDLSSAYKNLEYGSPIVTYYVLDNRLSLRSDGVSFDNIWNTPVLHTNRDVYFYNENGTLNDIALNKNVFETENEQNVCDRTAVLGAVSNVNEIKLNVKGETSALAEPLKGTFTLNYTSVIVLNENNFSVEFVNNSGIEVVGNYNFKCATDSYNCYLNYEYNTSDDITETVDFSFKIRSADNGIMPFIKIYSCTTNDNYTYISYDYTNGPSDTTTNNPSLDNILQNGDISGSQDTADGFFNNFTDNDYGLSSIITIPLSSIQKITNATCIPINLPVPFTNSFIPLPCMYDLYEDNVPSLLNIWQIVSFGLISYAIIVDIFSLVKKFKDPNDDKLEVMDL